MSEGGRSRGRARGRVRTQPPQQQQQPPTQARRPGEAPATAPQAHMQRPPPQRQQLPPQQHHHQQQQHHHQQQHHQQQQHHHQQQQQQQGGRALHRGARGGPPGGADGLASRMQQMGIGGDNGNGSVAVGRGASRGRKQAIDILKTKPETVETKKGFSGRPVVIKANFFSLRSVPNWCLWQYRVDFSPEEDRIGVRKSLLKVHKEQLGAYIFDGTMMFTGARLEHEEFEVFSKRESDDTTIRITIKRVGELGAGDHMYLQFFNILMRKALSALRLQLVGRDYYDAHAKISVPDYKLELWPGYLTSIRQHEEGILMCAEITHKVMRQDTVLNLLSECRSGGGDYRKIFESAIIGSIVLTDYNNHTYRIDDVDFNATPSSTFQMRDSGEVSYRDYYLKKYQIRIHSMDQPLLVSRTKPRERRAGMSEIVYLVPELCRLTGLTNDMRNNFNLMRALADYTRVAPDSRIDKLMRFNRRLENEQQVKKDLMEWNLQLATQLIEFGGRVLPSEKIVQGSGNDQKKYDAGPQTDWTRELRSSPMIYVPSFTNWAVIAPARAKRDTANFVSSVTSAARGMRFVIPQPYFHDIPDDRLTTYIDALEKLIAAKGPQLIMCVVSNNNAQRYGAIKKKCCVDRPVPTQVIVARSMTSKGVMSIATKVAIQMCCKIGGAPWSVEVPLTGLMVVGFDVCHDTNVRSRSYGAMVASLNRSFSRYYSAVSAHTSGEELSNYFSTNIIKALRKFQDYNGGSLPARIVVYRDGVGEGQLNYVYQHEVKLLEDNLKKVYKDQPVKLGFIVVSKRINTRLFLNNQNPPPGTIADDVITLPERYDFYLVSQSVRQGTVSPTSYNILYDTMALDPDKIQRLTYKLTHLYFNWSGTVRVPAPCQYAHKLAYLVGQAIHQEPSGKLEDILYFL